MSRVKTAVILCAGLGTRMLPATKAVPKEMLAIVDKPLLQYVVEETVAGGIEHIVFVIAPGKEAIREHFGTATRADAWARDSGNAENIARVTGPAKLARFSFVYQDQPKGQAHAVACAREHLEGEPFVLIFPDDVILGGGSVVKQMVAAYNSAPGSILAVEPVPPSEVSQYGIVAPDGTGNPVRLKGVVEKPPVDQAPSNLSIVGRYICSDTIFEHIDRIEPGVKGELWITDAFLRQIEHGEAVYAYQFTGDRYDTGRPLGYLEANIACALERPGLRDDFIARTRALLARGSSV